MMVELVVKVVMTEKMMDSYNLRHIKKMDKRVGDEVLATFFRNAVASKDYDLEADADVIFPEPEPEEEAEPKKPARAKKAKVDEGSEDGV